ncbi:hypothetical protein MVEN_01595000 [Mycena venus]|uniref:Uncharacterized protein n=1 Tax=Mycena venus TaxID=2733690 RepID=A0A8H7CSE2_9AGAR|nr:hypothetical protein MVEN_01595000 [Mycena venus]
MLFLRLLLCSLTLVVPLITFALEIVAPAQVMSPGILQINMTGQAEDPDSGETTDAKLTIYNAATGRSYDSPQTSTFRAVGNNTTAVSIPIPPLPNGGGWVVQALAGFGDETVIAISNSFFIQSDISSTNSGNLDGDGNNPVTHINTPNNPPQPISKYAIGGGVFGILALLLGVFRLVLFCTHRRRSESGASKLEAGQGTNSAPWNSDQSTSGLSQENLNENEKVLMPASTEGMK